MSNSSQRSLVAAEIVALHVEFEHWFGGTSKTLERVERALAHNFTFVSPQGDIVKRADLLAKLGDAHGSQQIRIRIEHVELQWSEAGVVAATYEEWHEHDDYTTSRLSTVVFTEDEHAPGGLKWRHVHETWKVAPPATK